MNNKSLTFFGICLLVCCVLGSAFASMTNSTNLEDPYQTVYIQAVQDTLPPLQERQGDFLTDPNTNPFDLKDPSIIEKEVEYDPALGLYLITEKIGEDFYREPTYLSFDEYLKYTQERQQQDYFKKLAQSSSGPRGKSGLKDPIEKFNIKDNVLDRLFGGSAIDIRPQGNIDLTFGIDNQFIENPVLTERQQRGGGGFDFGMQIQMNVTGKIGDKLQLGFNYNTQATFDVDNQMKLGYEGKDDEIIKKIEAGNVSLPLRSSLIQGSQSLFGIKTELQFGRLTLTSILSQQKSKRNDISIQGGSTLQTYEVPINNYDENRHFFLTHYNRDNFEASLNDLPQIRSLFKVSRIEVWVTNTRNQTENVRDIVAIADLGEADIANVANNNPTLQPPAVPVFMDVNGNGLPDNGSNPIFDVLTSNSSSRKIDNVVNTIQNGLNLQQTKDFEKVRGRLLSPREYTFHPELGFVSLNTSLNPADVVGVAVEYTYNGRPHKVGEFATDLGATPDSTGVLFVKMMKSTTQRVDIPMWDLMMKNIYSLGAFQVESKDFKLDVVYEDPGGGQKRFLPDTNLEGQPLIQIFNLDNLNTQNDPIPDGVFDYVPGLTIIPQSGKVIFPQLEPFGSTLANQITDPMLAERYSYQVLYDSTKTRAAEFAEFNRFTIKGSYRSSVSSDISLGAFNIPRGSVKVTAGGQQLQEGTDYTVDYGIGRVRIINESISGSGVPVNVSFEDNTLFGFQQKTLIGSRADYKISDKFNIGATWMRLSERPFTQKVNIGDDPILNNIYGADINYSTDAPWLTRMIDKLPLIQTKEKSTITFQAEGALLDPGHSSAISQEDEGTVYLDDFEGSSSAFDLRTPVNKWVLASTPQNDMNGNNPDFPEGTLINDQSYGVNRARLNWYQIDQTGIDVDIDQADNCVRQVRLDEVFPNTQGGNGQPNVIRTMDLTFDPRERGPYNFDLPEGTPYSEGLDVNGRLKDPESRWGGIMRSLQNTDFDQANIEFVEMWVMSPFLDDANGNPTNLGNGGRLVLNLGNVSEDIMRDSRAFYENSLPTENIQTRTDTTNWGLVPRTPPITQSFDNSNEARVLQDVGLDGLNNEGELEVFDNYVMAIQNSPNVIQAAKNRILADVSADDFRHYNDSDWTATNGVKERYQFFNNPQDNSRPPTGGRVDSSTNIPDSEDLNRDNTLNESESYFMYNIPLRRDNAGAGDGIRLDNRFIVEELVPPGSNVKWYRIKVPIDQFTRKVGGIQDFRSIRFIRAYLTGFNEPLTLRFARFQLVRNQWRRYFRPLTEDPCDFVVDFDVNAVSIEQNSNKLPFRYVIPPGVQREQLVNQGFTNALQNESSLAMNVCNLCDGEARAIYKIFNWDMRTYKRLKMFVHAESQDALPPGKAKMFMRIGSDFERNYYEYEIPLTMSDFAAAAGAPQEEYREEVWRTENTFDFPFELLQKVKLERNRVGAPLGDTYAINDPENTNGATVAVRGNPNLGLVKGIMIGVRNPEDDGDNLCVELWTNEMRLNGLDERGGLAGLARMDVKLADLGNLTVAGNYTGIGYGGLEDKVQQRQREEVVQLDASAQVELGKLLPEKSGVKIPFYASYSSTARNPEFDPYDLDIKLKDKLDNATDATQRDSIRQSAQDFTEIKTFNFTNVRKERTNNNRTPMPWNIENFSLDYSYSKTAHRDPLIESDDIRSHRGGVNYIYSTKGYSVYPFKKLIKKDKYLKFITEFNFNLVPNNVTFSTELDRQFQETTYRFSDPNNSTWYNKRFVWDRNYGLQWDFTKSLKFRFNAINNAVIDEPDERQMIDRFNIGDIDNVDNYRQDSIWMGIRELGRNKNYRHNFSLSYDVPLKNFPFLDFMSVKAQFKSDYAWSASSLDAFSAELGNVIQSSQKRSVNGDLNFTKLYNRSKYLKKINAKQKPKSKKPKKTRKKKGDKEGLKDKKGADKIADTKKKKEKDREPSLGERILLRPLMMLRKAKFTYSEDFSNVVPGFMPNADYLGLSSGFDAPGWGYVLGLQQPDRNWMLDNQSWISESLYLNQEVLKTESTNIDGRVTLEPFNDFKIDIEANMRRTKNSSFFFKKETATSTNYSYLAPRELGSYSITYMPIRTLFQAEDATTLAAMFNQFEDNRALISQRIGAELGVTGAHPLDGANYVAGYGRYQQEVLVPAFIAAYTGTDVNNVGLDLFKYLPYPNWKVSYNGLAKIPMFKKWFKSFTLNHQYRSTLTVNNYNTDLDYDFDNPLASSNINSNTDSYYSRLEIPAIVIQEQLSPLIGVDMRFQNDMTANFNWKKSRNLSLSTTDYQLSETKATEYVFGFGYKLKNVEFDFLKSKKKRKKKKKKDDKALDKKRGGINLDLGSSGKGGQSSKNLDFKIDFSWRNDITFNHLLDQDITVPTRGLKTIRLSPSIDYTLNRRTTLRLFYDYSRTIPATSASFPITTTQGGLTVRMSLN